MNTQTKRGRPKKQVSPDFKNDYLNVEEVAEMLDISVSHVYTLTSTKKIPHIKLLGKKLLFDKGEIKEWLKTKMVYTK
jgi:excisionase family DNA binding protein